ncbi:MAG: acyl carrier protein [Alphaproteobacteria bacterium]|nr:acyl carrier protein [Alphaproteobacteria bacterium]
MGKLDTAMIGRELCSFLKTEVLAPGVHLDEDAPLAEVGVDSFSLMELVLFIERRFGIVLPMAALTPDNVRSVRALGACLVEVASAA